MSASISRAATVGPHLELEAVAKVPGEGQFVLHRGHVFLSHRYGGAKELTVVDVSEPGRCEVVAELRFKNAITSVAVVGDTLLAGETNRALNFIDVSDPRNPNYFECGLALGRSIHAVAPMGRYAVLAMNWDGVGLMTIDDPARATLVDRHKLEEGYVDSIAVVGDYIFASGGSGGLHVFAVVDGKLSEVARHAGDKVRVGAVYHLGDRVWAVADVKNDEQIWRIDPTQPHVVEKAFGFDCGEPRAMLGLTDGTALGFSSNYRCMGFDAQEEWAGELFAQYTNEDGAYREILADPSELDEEAREALWAEPLTCMDGIRHAVVDGGRLIVSQSDELQVFRFTPGSVFERALG